jgi:hypothetical protein
MAQSRLLSIAALGALALGVACAPTTPRESVPEEPPVAAAASRVEPRVAPATPPALELAPMAEPAHAGPLGALSQMVTTQALLVSLFLAPVSKDGSEMMARADASARDGGTR